MSAGNTPSRPRGMAVPSIDTRSAFNGHQQAPQGLSNPWPMTPPQSIHDLRRPSLAYSSVSDASTSGPSSICDYSQPATPVHSLGHPNDSFTHSNWNVDSTMTGSIPDHCSLGHSTQPMYNPALALPMTGVEVPSFSPSRHHNITQSFGSHSQSPMRDVWSHTNHAAFGLDSGMRTTLFQSTQALGQGVHDGLSTSSLYANPSDSVHQPSLEPSAFHDFNNAGAPVYHPAQVVVPSQVNQEDYAMEQYPSYDTKERGPEDFSRSFDSSATTYSGWEDVGPQSPDSDYYASLESEDGVMVKSEASMTPGSRSYIHGRTPDRKRNARRQRKISSNSQVLAEQHHGFIIRYEGLTRDADGNLVATNSDTGKAQMCTYVDKNNVKCDAKFTRSEHLKRHMTKHKPEKLFPCPLAGCLKEMSRPDNAGDHFRTHLKGPAKGKRNKECTLEELTEAMHNDARWDEKKRTKMLNNLSKWAQDLHITQLEASRNQARENAARAHEERMQSRRMHCKM